MNKRIFAIDDLHMTITEKCNLNCDHCFRGQKSDYSMSKEIIEHSLDEVLIIGNLLFGGGEPMLAPQIILEIIDYIIKNKIIVTRVSIVTNGIVYSKEVVKILRKFSDYMIKTAKLKEKSIIHIYISKDIYHQKQIKDLNLENQVNENEKKYKVYFNVGYQYLGKIFKEGNAENLSISENFVNIVKSPLLFGREYENIPCPIHIGPCVVINSKGIITEASTSFEHQETIYNYGNIIKSSFSEIMKKSGSLSWDEYCYTCEDFMRNQMITNDPSDLKKCNY